MLDQKPPLDQRWLAEAERARCRLNEGRAAEGLSALDALPRTKVASTVAAELEYVKLCCLVALWHQARKEDGKLPTATWQQQAVAQLNRIQGLQRDYWFRRAELLLARAVEQSGGEDESGQLLRRTADNYYRQGELDAAASTYQQAAERAVLAGHEESALEISRLAAAVHRQQGNLGRAVTNCAPRHCGFQVSLKRLRLIGWLPWDRPRVSVPPADSLAVVIRQTGPIRQCLLNTWNIGPNHARRSKLTPGPRAGSSSTGGGMQPSITANPCCDSCPIEQIR